MTSAKKMDVRQGTLALMVLKTLDVLGPLHGYGLARRIEQISGDRLSASIRARSIPCCCGSSRRARLHPNAGRPRTTARRASIA